VYANKIAKMMESEPSVLDSMIREDAHMMVQLLQHARFNNDQTGSDSSNNMSDGEKKLRDATNCVSRDSKERES
jgi:hypothetical protein